MHSNRICLVAGLAFVLVAEPLFARPSLGGRGGGGGARPNISRGGGGGGGNRPNVSRPNVSRPNVQRPSGGNRPGLSNPGARPGGGNRPNIGNRPGGGNRPAGGNRPNIGNRPNTPNRPNIGNRPGLGDLRPNQPQRPGGNNRPSVRPPIANLPTRPGGDRPGINRPDRPNIRPDRPNIRPDRPNIRPDRPNIRPDRPNIRPDRPNIRPDRPNIRPDRPNIRPDRPIIGRPDRPNIRPDRPIIGGGNIINRPGGDNNININRPGININNPGWGVGNWDGGWRGNWGERWRWNNVHHHHHRWYNGGWGGHWGGSWYAPIAVAATAWAWGSMWNSWGVGPVFYNPYVSSAPVNVVQSFDFSQPMPVQTFATEEDYEEPPVTDEIEQSFMEFDKALEAFRAGDFKGALEGMNAALKLNPTDVLMHEARATALFAIGDYNSAAAVLNSVLATAPGFDWTTLIGLYGDPDQFTMQLRALEDHVKAKPDDAAARFVLAYQYLVMGESEAAADQLEKVIELQPRDSTSRKLLASIRPPEAFKPADANAQTDLVGKWTAVSGDSKVELTIDEESGFTWIAVVKGAKKLELSGTTVTTSDLLILDSAEQGTLIGQVVSGGPDAFTFAIQGVPPGDPGLKFQRVQ